MYGYDYDSPEPGECSECGNDTALGSDLCFSCREQLAIDNDDFSGWVFCPYCGSALVIQRDWRKPDYYCDICKNDFTDPNGKVIEGDE
jgi:DNA-directed RNA polymerase subunit RPC12/RpoP